VCAADLKTASGQPAGRRARTLAA